MLQVHDALGSFPGLYETLTGALLGGSANGTGLGVGAGLAAETPDDGKKLEYASLP